MDIKIGEKTHRITLFEDSDPTQVCHEFAEEHSLPEQMREALLKNLIAQYNANFGEEEGEEEDDQQ